MKKIIFFCCVLFGANASQASVLTFDDIGSTPTNAPIPNGYGGFNWSNMNYQNTTYPGLSPSGYVNGLVSGDYVAFNPFGVLGIVSNTNFTFNGAYFTAAWNDGLTIHAEGLKNGASLFTQDIIVNTDVPNYFNFNFVGIDTLKLSAFGGVDSPLYSGVGTHFAMDNFTVNAVPVPGAAWLFGSALMGLVGVARRKSAPLRKSA